MISPFCDYLRFDYDLAEEPLFMCGEVDGVRVFSRTCHRLIRCVCGFMFVLLLVFTCFNGGMMVFY